MNQIKEFLLKHPTRSKYFLLIFDIFLVLVATKMFINYNNIKLAISETAQQSEYKRLELAYTENFELPYEKSEYSNFFLKHENNILLSQEFIIKFQKIVPKENTGDNQKVTQGARFIKTPEDSRKQFFYEKILNQKNIESNK